MARARSAVDRKQAAPTGDILLLHLESGVQTEYNPEPGVTNQIFGWGRTQGSSPPSPVLKTANVRVTGTSTDAFGGPAIGSEGVNGAAWKGDSGGSQLANGVQVGVCSTGENTGSDPNGTQNYSSIANARSFIRNTAGV